MLKKILIFEVFACHLIQACSNPIQLTKASHQIAPAIRKLRGHSQQNLCQGNNSESYWLRLPMSYHLSHHQRIKFFLHGSLVLFWFNNLDKKLQMLVGTKIKEVKLAETILNQYYN